MWLSCEILIINLISEIILSSPAVMDHLNESDLGEVYERVFQARARWYNIGLKLNLHSSDLDVLKKRSPDEALREVLRSWLQRTNPAPTMNMLTEALRNTTKEVQPAPELQRAPEQRGMLQGT